MGDRPHRGHGHSRLLVTRMNINLFSDTCTGSVSDVHARTLKPTYVLTQNQHCNVCSWRPGRLRLFVTIIPYRDRIGMCASGIQADGQVRLSRHALIDPGASGMTSTGATRGWRRYTGLVVARRTLERLEDQVRQAIMMTHNLSGATPPRGT